MEAVKAGHGREQAHKIIKQHSHAVMEDLRKNKRKTNDLLNRLGQDSEFPLSNEKRASILQNPENYLGEAFRQVDKFCEKAKLLTQKFPEAENYTPQPLL